jgi:uncharacterized protein YaeQ
MALTATIYNVEIDLSDSDRHVYESLALRIARHPSESEPYLIARMLAYALEYTPGIEFSRGVSDANEPAIVVRDLTGAISAWIEVGAPSTERLHKASKAAPRVAVYLHKDPTQFLNQLAGATIHRAGELDIFALDRSLIDALVARLDRRIGFGLTVAEGDLYIAIGTDNLTGSVRRLAMA